MKFLKKFRNKISNLIFPERNEVDHAFETLRKALASDPGYAWGWHCNIAMPILDASNGMKPYPLAHYEANKCAEVVMDHLFGVKCVTPQKVAVRELRTS